MTGPRREIIALHRITKFRRVWIGLIAFELAYMVQFVASSWLMLQLTASPFWVGLMVRAPALPLLILGLPAGAVADMFDRRRVLAASSLVIIGASSGMGILWAVNLISPVRLLGLGLTLGVGLAFFSSAWQAIIPGLVPRTDLPDAVGLSHAIAGFATALGPVLGGVLVAVIGPGWTFGVATLGFSGVPVSDTQCTVGADRTQRVTRLGNLHRAAISALFARLLVAAGSRWPIRLLGLSASLDASEPHQRPARRRCDTLRTVARGLRCRGCGRRHHSGTGGDATPRSHYPMVDRAFSGDQRVGWNLAHDRVNAHRRVAVWSALGVVCRRCPARSSSLRALREWVGSRGSAKGDRNPPEMRRGPP